MKESSARSKTLQTGVARMDRQAAVLEDPKSWSSLRWTGSEIYTWMWELFKSKT